MAEKFDLAVLGGRIIDPATKRCGRYDIGVRSGRIASIRESLDGRGYDVIDASNCIVTPGLIDLHTHVYPGATYWGIHPDTVAWRSGVTTWIDAGSSGAYNIEGLQNFAESCDVDVLAMANVSCVGLVGRTGELSNSDYFRPSETKASIAAHPGWIRGMKIRLDRNTFAGDADLLLRAALEMCEESNLALMAHIGQPPPDARLVVSKLRRGDVLTHCASAMAVGLLDDDGHVVPELREAKERGVLFDLGHGVAGFSFQVAERMLAEGFLPDVISTDLHVRCLYGPVHDLPTVMMKMMAVGMTLEQVVAAVTENAAVALGLQDQLGKIEEGVTADLAVFEQFNEAVELVDPHGVRRYSPVRLKNVATIKRGVALQPRPPERLPPWLPQSATHQVMFRQRLDRMREAAMPTPGEHAHLEELFEPIGFSAREAEEGGMT